MTENQNPNEDNVIKGPWRKRKVVVPNEEELIRQEEMEFCEELASNVVMEMIHMMNDNDVINSEFYQIIKDKKVKVKLNDWGEWDKLYLDEHTCSVDEYDGVKIRVSESDLWLRLKRNLFDSWYEGDVRTLVGDKWFINQEFTEDDYKNDVKIEFNLEEEIEKLETIKN